jgi:hypothetical protein
MWSHFQDECRAGVIFIVLPQRSTTTATGTSSSEGTSTSTGISISSKVLPAGGGPYTLAVPVYHGDDLVTTCRQAALAIAGTDAGAGADAGSFPSASLPWPPYFEDLALVRVAELSQEIFNSSK